MRYRRRRSGSAWCVPWRWRSNSKWGADNLRTVVTASWSAILLLGAIILLRTVLNYFLQWELDAATKRAAGMLATEPVRDQVAHDGNVRTIAPEAARRG